MEKVRRAFFPTPLGLVEVVGTDGAVLSLHFSARKSADTSEWTPALEACFRQLGEYFSGTRTAFNLSLRPEGTPFQRKIWTALSEIPYGATASYAEIARAVGQPRAVRAVGAANGRNPISIIIPCHRVIGSSGSLVGYGGGLRRKEWLLAHERKFARPAGALFRE